MDSQFQNLHISSFCFSSWDLRPVGDRGQCKLSFKGMQPSPTSVGIAVSWDSSFIIHYSVIL